MNILAFDTSTEKFSISILKNNKIVLNLSKILNKTYSKFLISIIKRSLEKTKLDIKEINYILISLGPGSFTGIRIGLSTVKAFCQPLDIPVVGISTLAALAYRFSNLSSYIAPIIDAGRKQIYGAVYQVKHSEINIKSPERVLPPNEWLASIPTSQNLFVGDGVQLYEDMILSIHPKAQLLATNNQIIEQLCLVGHSYFRKGQTLTATNLAANYIRPSDAELNTL